MIKNPFKSPEGEFKLKRNGFDLSENRLFTSDFGKIYPFFCKEVLPGDTFEIDSQIGLRGMPTVFPIQTRMRMSVEYYYCRNRCVYEDFEDFIFKTKDNLEMPWLKLNNSRAKRMICTGSLGDAFRIPSTIGNSGFVSGLVSSKLFGSQYLGEPLYFGFKPSTSDVSFDSLGLVGRKFSDLTFDNYVSSHPSYVFVLSNAVALYRDFGSYDFLIQSSSSSVAFYCGSAGLSQSSSGNKFGFVFCSPDGIVRYKQVFNVTKPSGSLGSHYFIMSLPSDRTFFVDSFNSVVSEFGSCHIYFIYQEYDELAGSYTPVFNDDWFPSIATSSNVFVTDFYLTGFFDRVIDSTDDSVISSNPFVGDIPELKINVLPFRHLEMITNYFYRNDKNNPYVLNGNVEYNKFIPTYAGGADENIYDFHYRNFELDQFTSAVQSPQFGLAPLVGLTYSPLGESAVLKFQGTDSEGVSKQYTVTVGVNDQGIIDDIADFSKDIPSANLRKLQDQIQYGISINDLRVTNSFQRFLENTLRRGLRYRNQLKSHFGTNVDYPDIDVPQYIGGASGVIEPGQVTNTADSPNAGLGDYVGTLSGGVSQKHKIHHYCPEHGYIIGVVSFYPVPMYCQNVEKTMIKHDAFDFYQPEFGKIGFVPVEYSELFPLQTPDGKDVHDVFGYQKAWYDYMRSYDSVHGDFRTTLRDFTLMRTFSERPQLSESFTTVHPEQFNDIFVSNNIADAYGSSAKFMLSSHVSCIVRRPMPVHGVPSLE